jgi:hypothetical protein
MEIEVGRRLLIEGAEEAEELLTAVPGQTLADDLAVEQAVMGDVSSKTT